MEPDKKITKYGSYRRDLKVKEREPEIEHFGDGWHRVIDGRTVRIWSDEWYKNLKALMDSEKENAKEDHKST